MQSSTVNVVKIKKVLKKVKLANFRAAEIND